MKSLLLIFSLSYFLKVNGQKSSPCMILESILQYQPAVRPYYFDKIKNKPIVFIDTAGFFTGCKLGTYYGREVLLSAVVPAAAQMGASDYVLMIEQTNKRKVKLSLWYSHSGAYCKFVLKQRRGKYIVSAFREMYL